MKDNKALVTGIARQEMQSYSFNKQEVSCHYMSSICSGPGNTTMKKADKYPVPIELIPCELHVMGRQTIGVGEKNKQSTRDRGARVGR